MQPASWWRGSKIETWYEYIVESWKIWYDNQIDLKYELHKNAKSTMTQHDKAQSINKIRCSVCQGLDITFFSLYGIDDCQYLSPSHKWYGIYALHLHQNIWNHHSWK